MPFGSNSEADRGISKGAEEAICELVKSVERLQKTERVRRKLSHREFQQSQEVRSLRGTIEAVDDGRRLSRRQARQVTESLRRAYRPEDHSLAVKRLVAVARQEGWKAALAASAILSSAVARRGAAS